MRYWAEIRWGIWDHDDVNVEIAYFESSMGLELVILKEKSHYTAGEESEHNFL